MLKIIKKIREKYKMSWKIWLQEQSKLLKGDDGEKEDVKGFCNARTYVFFTCL